LERDNSSLKLALGVDEIAGGAVRSDCADALVTAAKIVTPTMIHGRMTTS
jgi:hypothetical protein